MLEEFFLLEEEHQNFGRLAVLGLLSGIVGFMAAEILFPTQSDILSVIFAAVPMIFSLTKKFLEDEADGRPHIPEIEAYLSIFVGVTLAFFMLALNVSDAFEIQKAVLGPAGNAVSNAGFSAILSNNLMVFSAVFLLSMLIGSAGAFILTWNASVLGVFLAGVAETQPLKVLAYLPHSLFEMSGFIIGGIAGSLISAAVYRHHFDRETWIDYLRLLALGVLCIFAGAFLETA